MSFQIEFKTFRRHLPLNFSFQKIKSKTAMDAFEVEEVNISSSITALTHLLSEFIEGQVRFPQKNCLS